MMIWIWQIRQLSNFFPAHPDPLSRVHLFVVHSVLVIDGDVEYTTAAGFTWIDCVVWSAHKARATCS